MNNDTSIYLENIEKLPTNKIKFNKEPWSPENPVDLIKVVDEIKKIVKEKCEK